ncbi:MAG: hypothetical protein EBV20_08250 [Betaproteobacteria bacterium]|jgi:hypothetical protein|nr:hypothetical protein [Betaproteobacteria bacterium]NBP44058.1 hypothetical protein [Betaproteobacteria bacterium]
MKNKTLATWISLVGGPFGLHRVYLYGWKDGFAWAHFFLTLLGLLGLQRLMDFGVDDPLSWWLLPLLGFSLAWNCLEALILGLMSPEQWNQRFNPSAEALHPQGLSNWITVVAIVLALMVGATALISGLAMSFQHYFEAQIQEGLKLAE